MMWYDVIWYDIIWYNVIWCDTMQYDMRWYDVIGYDMTWYGVIWYDMMNEKCAYIISKYVQILIEGWHGIGLNGTEWF